MTDNNTYDIKSIAVDLMRVADSLERHNQLQAAILAEMRAARCVGFLALTDEQTMDYKECPPAIRVLRAADRLTADALDEEDEG